MTNRLLELERTLPRAGARAARRPVAGPVQSFSAIDYRVPGIVPLVRQPQSMACWATVGAMMIAWRDNASRSLEEVIAAIGPAYSEKLRRNTGLTSAETTAFLASAGLVGEWPQSASAAGWESMLRAYGPLFVIGDERVGPGRIIHARIITGIHGDGTEGGTSFDIVDPATGTSYPETVERFRAKFEDEVRETGTLRMQIVHWPRDVQFTVARSMRDMQAMAEHDSRSLLSDDELVQAEPLVAELAPRGRAPARASALSFAAAAPARMTAKDVTWPDDALAPDYRHLASPGLSQRTPVTGQLLRRLCELNGFVLPKDAHRVVVGLRGCQLAAASSAFSPSVTVLEDIPNHIDNRCAVGVWNRDDDTVVLFEGSTVPNWKLMENFRQGGDGSNMMPTGLYRFIVGTHRPTRKQKNADGTTSIVPNPTRVQGALLQAEDRVELRTTDDLTYTVFDRWDGGWVGDNIHPAMKQVNPAPSTEPDFSSAGCNTVPGFSSGDRPSGSWASFRAALGFDNATPTADDGKRVFYILLTARDARIASDRPKDQSLMRLRFGSSGAPVTALQLGLRNVKGSERLKASGVLDESTALAYIRWQQANDNGAADCIVTPATARALGFDMIAQQSLRMPAGGSAPSRAQSGSSFMGTKPKRYVPATIPLDPGVGGRSIGVDDLKVGDIILSTTPDITSRTIRTVTGSEVSHAILYIGDGEVVEAVGKGVVRRPLSKAIKGSYVAVALRDPDLTDEQAQKIRTTALGWVGRKYDTLAIVDHAVHFVSGVDPTMRDASAFTCSELVLEAYEDAGVPLTTVSPGASSPQDVVRVYLARSLEYVGHLKTQL